MCNVDYYYALISTLRFSFAFEGMGKFGKVVVLVQGSSRSGIVGKKGGMVEKGVYGVKQGSGCLKGREEVEKTGGMVEKV